MTLVDNLNYFFIIRPYPDGSKSFPINVHEMNFN